MPDNLPKLIWNTEPNIAQSSPADGRHSVWLDVPLGGNGYRVKAFLPCPQIPDLYIIPRQLPYPSSDPNQDRLIYNDDSAKLFYKRTVKALIDAAAGREGKAWLEKLINIKAGSKVLETVPEMRDYLANRQDYGYFDAYTSENGREFERLPHKMGKFLIFAPNEKELQIGRISYPYEPPVDDLLTEPAYNGQGGPFIAAFTADSAASRLGSVNEEGMRDGIIYPVTQMLKLLAWGVMSNLGILPTTEFHRVAHPWFDSLDPASPNRAGYYVSRLRDEEYPATVKVARLELLVSSLSVKNPYQGVTLSDPENERYTIFESKEFDRLRNLRIVPQKQAIADASAHWSDILKDQSDDSPLAKQARAALAIIAEFEQHIAQLEIAAADTFEVTTATADSLEVLNPGWDQSEVYSHIQINPADLDPKVWDFINPDEPYESDMRPRDSVLPTCLG